MITDSDIKKIEDQIQPLKHLYYEIYSKSRDLKTVLSENTELNKIIKKEFSNHFNENGDVRDILNFFNALKFSIKELANRLRELKRLKWQMSRKTNSFKEMTGEEITWRMDSFEGLDFDVSELMYKEVENEKPIIIDSKQQTNQVSHNKEKSDIDEKNENDDSSKAQTEIRLKELVENLVAELHNDSGWKGIKASGGKSKLGRKCLELFESGFNSEMSRVSFLKLILPMLSKPLKISKNWTWKHLENVIKQLPPKS